MSDVSPSQPRRFFIVRGAILGILALLVAGWFLLVDRRAPDPTTPVVPAEVLSPGVARGMNVLLVTLDTTRPDHLGCYGAGDARTPHIDGLLSRGVRFDHAVVAAPLTLPSHCTIMTGLRPYAHGVRTNGGYRLDEKYTTLAERFSAAGYDTAAFVACFVLERRFGLDQGFDVFDFAVSAQGQRGPQSVFNEREADKVTDAALAWLRERDLKADANESARPFFMWVHYYDPHHPYRSPLAMDPAFRDRTYDAEIAFVDQQFGRLPAALDRAGLRRDTLIVVATDHGESLGGHGEDEHGLFVYDATMRGGLILSNPRLFARPMRVDDRVVGMVDVAPTLVSLCGLAPLEAVDGWDLTARHDAAERAIYIESLYPLEGRGCAPLYGLRRLHDKFVHTPQPEYYDLAADPNELDNLYTSDPPELATLQLAMEAILAAMPGAEDANSAQRAISDEERRRLESLGYLSGAATEMAAGDLPDIKERIETFNQVDRCTRLIKEGDYEAGLTLAKAIMREAPGYETPVHLAAYAYEGLGRHAEGVALLEEFAETHASANVFIHIAKLSFAQGDWTAFERALDAAAVIEPDRGALEILRGDRAMIDGRLRSALRHYERAFAMDPHRMGPEEEEKLATVREKLGIGANS